MRYQSATVLVIIISLLLFTGCSGTQPAMRYYQLTPTSTVSSTEPLSELILGVGPVTIPEMLKRQEIVIRGDGNQYRLSELHRWAGLLENNLTMVIMENLGKLLDTDQVVRYPWESYDHPDYRIIIEVLDLTGNPGGVVSLRAGWTIVDGSGQQMLVRIISEYAQQATDQSVDSLVQAESQAVALLCQEISVELRKLENQ